MELNVHHSLYQNASFPLAPLPSVAQRIPSMLTRIVPRADFVLLAKPSGTRNKRARRCHINSPEDRTMKTAIGAALVVLLGTSVTYSQEPDREKERAARQEEQKKQEKDKRPQQDQQKAHERENPEPQKQPED